MRVAIHHETVYRYSRPADYSIQYLRLTPRSSGNQRILSWKLELPAPVRPWLDGFGNEAHVLVIDRPHRELCIRARGEVDLLEDGESLGGAEPLAADTFLRSTRLTAVDDALARFAESFRKQIQETPAAGLKALMLGVREAVEYRSGTTDVTTSAREVFKAKAGVCQDHAHVFIACCRHLGVPARYVSGYLATDRDGQMASHAWAEALVPAQGFASFDVANRLAPAKHHVKVAVGMDYLDACPVRGFRRGGSGESLEVEVRVAEDAARLQAMQEQQQQ
jgi:transglutaminase-like putative cysteine protease